MEIVQHIVASNIIVLAKEIKEKGLHNPIHVIQSKNGYVLLAGAERLRAVMSSGEPLIAAKVIDAKVRPENFYEFHKNYTVEMFRERLT